MSQHIKILIVILLFLVSSNSYSFKPPECGAALNRLFVILIKGNKLITASKEIPGQEYKHADYPRICYISVNENEPLQYSWLIHMSSDDVSVVFERKEIKSMKSTFYGPFKSAYKK